ncbi:MAG: FTR1 family protein [Flaviflexus sp.]|nr:FTR1 family protein [Flaviflexus sp.]
MSSLSPVKVSLTRYQRILAVTFAFLLLSFCLVPMAQGADADDHWTGVSEELTGYVDEAVDAFEAGDTETARELVKKARYDVYGGKGLEEQISSQLSGADAGKIDMDFGMLTKSIKEGDAEGVAKYSDAVNSLVTSSARELDGEELSADDLVISPGKWGQTASTMVGLLDDALAAYNGGDPDKGKDLVNEAYYGHYEITGFEKMTMARVSGGRVAHIELEFALIKKAMNDGKDDEVATRIEELKPELIKDANTLDGFDGTATGTVAETSSAGVFIPAFLVILREGIEAMLVVAAVIAYLVKSGHKDKTKVVWFGALAALAVSVLLAIAISTLTGMAGQSQEIIEGVTALIAVAMLVYVSNWMIGKSDAAAWDKFIKDKTDTSLSKGSLASLAFVAFLAVVREGAETILFYQPILASAEGKTHLVWLGMGAGVAALLVVYLAIRFLSIKIPLRPFFIATSLLLALMALTFTGSGIRELQEGDAIGITPLEGLPTIDLLGIYPQVESLAAQAIVLAVIIGLFIFGYRRNQRQKINQ